MINLKEKTQRRLRNVSVTFLIICLTPLCERGRILSGAHAENALAGKEVTCAIDLGDDMYGSHGLETGFNYELLNRFAEDNHCSVKIVTAKKGENYLDSLKLGKVDMVITHDKASMEAEGMSILREVDECSAWALNGMDQSEIRQMNTWLGHITSTPDFENVRNRYHGTFDPGKRAENGVITTRVSPYDEMLKKYASTLGWDWRMLAAVVYQESKFSIGSTSFRGAVGLMQVMPQTGRYYGIEDLLDPEQNILAGTSHLKRLQRLMSRYGFSQEELVKFTLAAYNAGEGRIMDCINFAISKEADSSKWEEIVKLIPQMREDSILEEESVKLGKFQGHETIAYVDSIMHIYRDICTICPRG